MDVNEAVRLSITQHEGQLQSVYWKQLDPQGRKDYESAISEYQHYKFGNRTVAELKYQQEQSKQPATQQPSSTNIFSQNVPFGKTGITFTKSGPISQKSKTPSYKIPSSTPSPEPFISSATPMTLSQQADAKRIKAESVAYKVSEKVSQYKPYQKVTGFFNAIRYPFLDIIKGKKKQYEETPGYAPTFGIPDVAYKAGQPPTEKKETAREKEERERFGIITGSTIKAENESQKIVDEEAKKAQDEYDYKIRQIEKDYAAGILTRLEAMKKAEDVLKEVDKRLSDKIKVKVEDVYEKQTDLTQKEIKQRQKEWADKGKLSVLQDVAIGGVYAASWAIPGLGWGFAGSDVAQMGVQAPSLVSGLVTSPVKTIKEIGPGIIGASITSMSISGIKNTITNNKIKTAAIAKQRNLKLESSNSLSVGKAIKIGVTPQGITLWKVEVKSVSRIINKKTGKIVEKSGSVGYAEVATVSSGKAQQAVVNSLTTDFRRGGMRVYKQGNKITLKGELTKATGTFDVFGTPDRFIIARGKVPDIRQSTLRMKAVKEQVTAKAKFPDISGRSAMVDSLFKRVERYREVKKIKGQKIKGMEEIYKGKVISDIYKDLINVKGYKRTYVEPLKVKFQKIKQYRRKPGKEIKPFRDIGIEYQKVFIPKKVQDTSGFLIGSGTPKPKLRLKLGGKTAAELSVKAQLKAVQDVVSLKRIEAIKKAPPKVKLKSVVQTREVINSLVGSVVIDGVRRKVKIRNREITRVKSREEQQGRVTERNMEELGNILTPFGVEKTRERERTIEQQRVNQMQRQQQKQMQKQMQRVTTMFSIPTIPRVPLRIPPRVPTPTTPKFRYDYKPKKQTKKQIKAIKKKQDKQRRAYQASVASYSLSIFQKKEPTQKQFTGLEIRPIIGQSGKEYLKRVNKAFSL